MVYPGRREPILVGLLALDGVVTLVVCGWLVWRVAAKQGPPVFLFVAPMLLLSFLSATWILLHSNYAIEGTDLIVRQGPTRRVIPIASIAEVQLVPSGPLAGRLQASFARGTKPATLLLNPVDREALLRGLAEADPGLAFDGQRVTRGAPI